MKKLLITLASALLLSPFAAPALEMTLVIDNADAVIVQRNDASYTRHTIPVVTGTNTLTVDPWDYVYIDARNGHTLRSVTGQAKGDVAVSAYAGASVYLENANDTFTVVTGPELETRTASCTVNIDNPSGAVICRGNSSNGIAGLSEGTNIIKFDPSSEARFSVRSSRWDLPLHEVRLNGTPLVASYSSYNFNVSEGDVIDITANLPQQDVNVNIICNIPQFITSLTLDGEPQQLSFVDNKATVTAQTGNRLVLDADNTSYKVNKFYLDDQSQFAFYGRYTTTLTADIDIEFIVEAYATLTSTIDIDSPENVRIYAGDTWNNNILTLLPGRNTHTFLNSGNNNLLTIYPEDGCYIESVTAGSSEISPDPSGYYEITLQGGETITIKSAKITRDCQAVIFREDTSPVYSFTFLRADRTKVDLVDGYNIVPFYTGDLPFATSWFGATIDVGISHVYVDGERITPIYEGSDNYRLYPDNGSVIKLYNSGEPQKYNVTFSTTPLSGEISVLQDIITPVTDLSAPLTVLAGTRITIRPADPDAIESVTANILTLTPDTDGAYNLDINVDTEIHISGNSAGLESVTLTPRSADVYNMQGILILRNADTSAIRTLPAGIYIIGGKKTSIR